MSDDINNNDNDNEPIEETTNEISDITTQLTFIDKIIEFFTGISTDDRIRQKKLKEIEKKLKRQKYKFYDYKNDQVMPQFGQIFYEIYRMNQNLSKYFDVKNHSRSIKQLIIDYYSDEKQKKLNEQLQITRLNELLKSTENTKEAIDKIKNILNEYVKSFEHDVIKKINFTFNELSNLANIINFDWFLLLHKFDADINESNFDYTPNFELTEGKYILDELIALSDYFETIDLNIDFSNIFKYIKTISGDENLIKILKKTIHLCRIIKKDNYIIYMIQLINKDPFFKPKKFTSNTNIVQDYIFDFQIEIKKIVENALKHIKKEKVNKFLMSIFHTTAILRLKNYTQKLNELVEKKGVSGFKFIDPLNYLKAFLLDFCKGELKSRIDFLIIKGTWATNSYSSEYSRLLDDMNNLSDLVVDFDNNCSEDGNFGRNIRKISFAASHDPNAKMLLSKTIFKIDHEALDLLIDGKSLFEKAMIKLKVLLEDYGSKTPKIIVNFHKIKWDFQSDVQTEITNLYKKIYTFVSLLNFYTKGVHSDTPKE